MKRHSLIIAFIFLASNYLFSNFIPSEKLELKFFGSEMCAVCKDIQEDILEHFAQKYPEKIRYSNFILENPEHFALLDRMEQFYQTPRSMPIVLFVADTFLLGDNEIKRESEDLITQYLNMEDRWVVYTDDEVDDDMFGLLSSRAAGFTFMGVLAAGLIDGVNPCAIATMIFLISYLSVKKHKRNEILAIGMSYTFAVFITYFMLGVGAFHVLNFLQSYRIVSHIIKWSAVVFAGGVALYSFKDAITYKITGKTDSISLQLPKSVKFRIRKVISGHLSTGSLITGSLIIGFLVTLLEAVCTGQVYLPTIILMTRESGLRLRGILWLLFYNLLFVLPLLIIMILAYYGLTWEKLNKFLTKNMFVMKMSIGILLAFLAIFLAVSI